MNVLIVEDSHLTAYLLSEYFSAAGWSTTQTASPSEALTLLRLNVYDGVVLDYKLPEMNGDELLRALRKDPAITRGSVIPVVLVTAMSRGVLEALRGVVASRDPAVEVLGKPVEPGQIMEALVRMSPKKPPEETP